jgi:acetyltransferase
LRERVFIRARELHATELGRLTQIDYDREMAFVAVVERPSGNDTIGVVRAIADPDHRTAQFAIIVRSDLKGRRLGTLLLRKMTGYCRARGIERLTGEAAADNERVFALARRHGFALMPSVDGKSVTLVADLAKRSTDAEAAASS